MIFYVWLITMASMPNHHLWSRMIGSLTVTKYVGIICVVLALLHILARRSLPLFRPALPVAAFLGLYTVQMFSCLTAGSGFALGDSEFAKLAALLMLFISTLGLVDSLGRMRCVMLVLFGALAVSSTYVIRQYSQYGGLYAGFRTWGGVSGDSNYYALNAALWLPSCFLWAFSRRPSWERWFCFGCIAVTAIAFSITASRGGFVAITAGALFLMWRSRNRLRLLLVAAAFLVLLGLVVPSPPLARLVNPSHGDEESVTNRLILWRASISIFLDHPIAGIGTATFKQQLDAHTEGGRQLSFSAVHNTYLEAAAQLGLLGLLPLVTLLGSAFCSLERADRSTRGKRPLLRLIVRGLQGGLVGYAMGGVFLSTWWHTMSWELIFLSFIPDQIERIPLHSAALPRAA